MAVMEAERDIAEQVTCQCILTYWVNEVDYVEQVATYRGGFGGVECTYSHLPPLGYR